jgi:hypothetical protein
MISRTLVYLDSCKLAALLNSSRCTGGKTIASQGLSNSYSGVVRSPACPCGDTRMFQRAKLYMHKHAGIWSIRPTLVEPRFVFPSKSSQIVPFPGSWSDRLFLTLIVLTAGQRRAFQGFLIIPSIPWFSTFPSLCTLPVDLSISDNLPNYTPSLYPSI